ncbi:MAG: hypothetical protein WD021_06730 [Rhodothermales bacterium]
MSGSFESFMRDAPCWFCPEQRCRLDPSRYKYFVRGKGCMLGVLFEDTLNVYFEWLTEEGRVVDYGPELRYRCWTKREFARLMAVGVWEPEAELAV